MKRLQNYLRAKKRAYDAHQYDGDLGQLVPQPSHRLRKVVLGSLAAAAALLLTITWFKNGVRITSGITLAKIQVVKRVDGTDLVGVTSMIEIASIGSYKYDETVSGNRVSAGEAVVVLATGTIDGSSREFAAVITRDN